MLNKLITNKGKPGRPVSISKETITKRCLDFYLLNGIDNQSFNNVIKHAGVSKGSIYRLYGSEDSLQKSAMVEYYKTVIKEMLEAFKSQENTLKKIIMDITSGLISNRYKTCLYHRSRMEKYKLGRETRKYIYKIDAEIEKTLEEVTRKEFSKRNRRLKISEIRDIVNFLVNGITTLNLLKLNRSSHKLMLSFANMMIKFVNKF
ncbi:MAG: hypothetical protein CMJ08_06030 [Pelagibacterales bacterium]|nr:hypothetical protein [Pelagibacterales bacterium]